MVASVPELWKRTFSALGMSCCTCCPHLISRSEEALRCVPRAIWLATAATISGCEWPRIIEPWPVQ